MNKCKICNSAADKSGSHIVPHFLMKRIDSEEGKKGRDKEMGFVITNKNPSSYFGRSTSENKLNEVYGIIDEERIDGNQIPLVEDYIFCSKCEGDIGKLESTYSESLNTHPQKGTENYLTKLNSDIAMLFWISIIFRLSISKNSGVRILPIHEEMLRNILNDYFLKGFLNSDASRIKYKLLRSINFSLKNSTILHFNPESINPYLLLVDEYLIVFSIDTEASIEKFYSVHLPTKEAAENNIARSYESIFSLTPNILSQLKQAILNKAADLYKENFSDECDIIFARLKLGEKMPVEMKEEIFDKVKTDVDVSFGDKFSLKHRAKIMCEVLEKYVSR